MQCIIVGADKLGTTREYLKKNFGVTHFLHWDGRKKKLPSFPAVDMVVVMTGFVNHKLMLYAKSEARRRGIKVLYLNKGKSELEKGA